MQTKTKTIGIEKTKKGYPALWEEGGGMSNTGNAVIIANADGTAKKPVYIRKRGTLSCDRHALFIVEKGDVVIEADHHRRDFVIHIWRIDQIQDEEAQLTLIHEYSRGEWDVEPPDYLESAIDAAQEKAVCYHCRRPHYYWVEVE